MICLNCGYTYLNEFLSTAQLHLCSDQEMHYVNRIDLEEEPLIELIEDIPEESVMDDFIKHRRSY